MAIVACELVVVQKGGSIGQVNSTLNYLVIGIHATSHGGIVRGLDLSEDEVVKSEAIAPTARRKIWPAVAKTWSKSFAPYRKRIGLDYVRFYR